MAKTDPFQNPAHQKKYLKIAMFGKGATGKTRAALSFPKPCVIDGEHGTDPYEGKYEFKVFHTNSWNGIEEPLKFLRANPGIYETLIIDPMTVFYSDLINSIIQVALRKRNQEFMDRGMWGIEKRRFAALMRQLTDLPMHVILSFREADIYAEQLGPHGEEILKKTGDFRAEADKQIEYMFDINLRCYTEEDKKNRQTKFLFQVTKTRYDWLPKYSVHDFTQQRAFPVIFEKHVVQMLDAPAAPASMPEEGFVIQEPQPEKPTAESVAKKAEEVAQEAAQVAADDHPVDDRGAAEIMGEILEKFAGSGDPDAPLSKPEDIKVLMTRCAQMTWPDGSSFQSEDGKIMLKALYKIKSTKEMKKYQCDFLYNEFGEVLAGRAVLERDETGCPYVRRLSGVSV